MVLAQKHILVVGLGMSGVAAARFLKNRGASVTITDMAKAETLSSHLSLVRGMGIETELGRHRFETFENADLIVLSPGVPHTISPVTRAKEKGIPVIGEIELASWFIREPIVAITGTNGKTTTTVLLGEMLRKSGHKVFVGGNIGDPLIGYADKAEKAEIVVAEVSSFQLDTIDSFRPRVGVLLNIAEDHLDRYPDFSAYAESKSRIFENQQESDVAIFNGDDPLIRSIAENVKSRTMPFYYAPGVCPETKYGGAIGKDRIVVNPPKRFAYGQKNFRKTGSETGNFFTLDLSEINLPGRHNLENVTAACLAAFAVGATAEGVRAAVRNFKGLPHRLEYVASVDEVGYFDDSKATNVDSVVRALECFSRPVILIMGGRDKGGDYGLLKDGIRRHAKILIVMGEAKEAIRSALGSVARIKTAGSMEDAVSQCHQEAVPGDVVLLSPGCSSFDMYENYAQRGEFFRKAVSNLKKRNP
jgi:UDP-N-acetylmuramoylalanine--D-glutamate ligase